MNYEIMTVVKLSELLEKENFNEKNILVDIRDPEEYEEDHIENAINITYDSIMTKDSHFTENDNTDTNPLALLDTDKTIIIYCERGGRSIYAGKKLSENNYTVKSLAGGYVEYQRFKNYT